MQPLVVKNFTLLGSIALPDVIIWSYLKSEEDGTMTFQDRLHRLRRERGLSQEGLAEIVGVTRQAVQKWESGASRPDMDNLTALARYFGVSLDYLITGTESPSGPAAPPQIQTVVNNYYHRWEYEYKSQRTLWGLPLVHIHLQDNGFARAKGIIAIGNVATGLVSAGVISVGLVSLGVISLGLLVSIGCVAAGLLAAGGLAAGAVAAGGFAFGWLALGGISFGTYAAGGIASASEIAVGGVVQAPLAVGAATEGVQTITLVPGEAVTPETRAVIRAAIAAALDGRYPWLETFLSGLL